MGKSFLGLGAGIRPWWDAIRKYISSSGIACIDGQYLMRGIPRGKNGFHAVKGPIFQEAFAEACTAAIRFLSYVVYPHDWLNVVNADQYKIPEVELPMAPEDEDDVPEPESG